MNGLAGILAGLLALPAQGGPRAHRKSPAKAARPAPAAGRPLQGSPAAERRYFEAWYRAAVAQDLDGVARAWRRLADDPKAGPYRLLGAFHLFEVLREAGRFKELARLAERLAAYEGLPPDLAAPLKKWLAGIRPQIERAADESAAARARLFSGLQGPRGKGSPARRRAGRAYLELLRRLARRLRPPEKLRRMLAARLFPGRLPPPPRPRRFGKIQAFLGTLERRAAALERDGKPQEAARLRRRVQRYRDMILLESPALRRRLAETFQGGFRESRREAWTAACRRAVRLLELHQERLLEQNRLPEALRIEELRDRLVKLLEQGRVQAAGYFVRRFLLFGLRGGRR